MILLTLVALAEPLDLESRLLGDEVTTARTVPASGRTASPPLGYAGLLLGLAALGVGVWGWRRELPGTSSGDDALKVVGRKSIPSGGLVLVDVQGLDGTTHRLVLGTGSSGPRVLADVSVGLASFGEEEEA